MRAPDASSRKRLPRNVLLLGWASFLNDVASEIIFPLMPVFLLKVVGGGKLSLGAIEGVADSVASLLKLASGAWSDRVANRKGLVVFGYALAALTRPLTGIVWAPWQLLAVRLTDRVGKGVRTSPRDAMIAESTDSHMRGRAFGFHRGMDHLGAAVGPLLAFAFLALWPAWSAVEPLRVLFLLTLVPGLLVVVLLLFGLREVQGARQPGETFHWTLKPFDWRFRAYLVALVLFTLGNSSDAFLLVRASELGVSEPLLPILWSGFHIAKSAGNMLAGRAVDRIGPRPMILLGWACYAAIYLGFAFASAAWHVWLLFFAYAVFYALTEPAERTLVANLVGNTQKGLAYGWFHFAIGVATLPASLIFGALYQAFGSLVAFGSGAAFALLASALLGASVRGAHGR